MSKQQERMQLEQQESSSTCNAFTHFSFVGAAADAQGAGLAQEAGVAAAAVAALPPGFVADEEQQLQLMQALVDLSLRPGSGDPGTGSGAAGPGSDSMGPGSSGPGPGSCNLAAELAAAAAASLLSKASQGVS